MTCRELILYILSNGLEDEQFIKDGKPVGLITISEAAAKMSVGDATIHAWILQRRLDHVVLGNQIFVPITSKSPLDNQIIKGEHNE